MTTEQAKAFDQAVQAAGIKAYEFTTDLGTHLYHGGNAVAKIDYTHNCILNFRATDMGGRPNASFNGNIQATLSNFDDIHEVRCAGDYDQITKFIDSIGSISLTDDELKLLLQIDKKNYNLIPETGDYNRFHYLSKKAYEALTDDEKKKYDEDKAAYEDAKEKYIGQNAAASITL